MPIFCDESVLEETRYFIPSVPILKEGEEPAIDDPDIARLPEDSSNRNPELRNEKCSELGGICCARPDESTYCAILPPECKGDDRPVPDDFCFQDVGVGIA